MQFASDEEDGAQEKIAGLCVIEIAARLAEATPEGDAYDVLRNVLTSLGEQARERRDTTH